MSRSRNIKPGFFRNEVLVELPFEYRLLYIGTWTHADREGRFEDRPLKIKMELFPADNIDVDAGLHALQEKGFLLRYSVGGAAYCQIIAWAKHQNPHHREQPSLIPAAVKPEACTGLDSDKPGTSRADSLFSDSLNLIPSSKAIEQQAARSTAKSADRFEEFWAVYPVKKGRANALRTWAAKKLDSIADKIIADVKQRIVADRQWLDGYTPHGSSYINRRGWEDAIEPVRSGAAQRVIHGDFKPRANDDFKGTAYTGTPLENLSPELRDAVAQAMGGANAA